jgi:hypothetical protein
LASDDLTQAELLERRHGALGTEAWAPYSILKARVLVGLSRSREAVSLLDGISRTWNERPETLVTRRLVAAASHDDAGVLAAERGLTAIARSAWPANNWIYQGDLARVTIVPDRTAKGLEIALSAVPATGAVIEVRLDGSVVAVRNVGPGRVLAIAGEISADPHLLEIETVAGPRVTPSDVSLVR